MFERKSALNFEHFIDGACTVVKDQIVVLCFNRYKQVQTEASLCRYSESGPLGSFKELPKSYYPHFGAQIASLNGERNVLLEKL